MYCSTKFNLLSAIRSGAIRPNRFFEDPPLEEEDPPTPATPPVPVKKPDTKGFTQAEVDRIVQQRLKKKEQEREELLGQLSALQQQGLTPENVDQLNQRIEALQNEGKTKEQLALEEKGKLEKKHKKEVDEAHTNANQWKGRYEQYRAQTDILTAAVGAKAHNPQQIYQILRPDTVIVAETGEDGKPTGEFVPRVNFRDKDKDGKDTVLQFSVPDAIKRMTEQEVHANLFESGASNGVGGYNKGRQTIGNTAIPTDTKSYMEARKKDKNLLSKSGTKA